VSVVWQTATIEHMANVAVWKALNTLILTRSDPKVERWYTILLFRLGNGEPIDICMFADLEAELAGADVQEFLNLAAQL
jgi:hypothetical protein